MEASIQRRYRHGLGEPLRIFEKFGGFPLGRTKFIGQNEPKEEYDISYLYNFTLWPRRETGDFGKDWKHWGNSGKWIRKSVLEDLNELMEHLIADADPEIHRIPDEAEVQELKRVLRAIDIGYHLDR